jgi:hypothetical protein
MNGHVGRFRQSLNVLGNFCFQSLVTEVTVSPKRVNPYFSNLNLDILYFSICGQHLSVFQNDVTWQALSTGHHPWRHTQLTTYYFHFFKTASLKVCITTSWIWSIEYTLGKYRWLAGDPVWDVQAFLLTMWSTYPLHDYDEFIPCLGLLWEARSITSGESVSIK